MDKIGVIILLCFVSLIIPVDAYCSGRTVSGNYKSGELIVKFRQHGLAGASHKAAKTALKASLKRLRTDVVRLPSTLTVREAIKQYQKDPNVEYAEPNYLVRKAAVPDDPRFSEQWNMQQIAAPRAWDSYTGSSSAGSVIVAVLDTGIDYTHPDLKANLWTNPDEIPENGIDDDANGIIDDFHGASFNNGTVIGNPMDDDTADSHGTHVAGIIGAVGNNSLGVAGVNWQVRMMAIKFLHGPEGFGELADALKGVEYAIANGAKIINCSFEAADDPSLAAGIRSLKDALLLADSSGVLVVSAAGNTGSDLDLTGVYPASIKTANNIAVAATGVSDRLTPYSDFGKTVVAVAAPGGDATDRPSGVLSAVKLTAFDGSILFYRTTAGTSMAAPHVAGLAALIWNMNPTLDLYQVKARIFNSVDKQDFLAPLLITGGRINAEKALKNSDLPAIFAVDPNRIAAGTASVITVTGANFGSSTGTVALSGVPLTVSSWSDRSITALVPASALSGELKVNGIGSGFPLTIAGPPKVSLTASPSKGKSPLDVTFNAAVIGSGERIVRYEWDFGAGVYNEISGSAYEVTNEFTEGGTYLVRVRVTDDLGQSAEAGTTVEVAGGSVSSGCFIATAAYGSYLHPKVELLRRFRDSHLLTNRPGRAFVAYYYRISPGVAAVIARHESLRLLTRWLLTPILFLIEYPVGTVLLCWLILAMMQRAALRSAMSKGEGKRLCRQKQIVGSKVLY